MKNILEIAILCFSSVLYFLIFLDYFTCIEIKLSVLKSIVYIGSLVVSPVIIISSIYLFSKHQKLILIPAVMLLIFFSSLGPLKYFCMMSTWKTQTVLFVHGHFKFIRIEHQMQDAGAFGYNKRIVKIVSLAKIFTVVTYINEKKIDSPEWIRSDEFVNELNLK